MGEYVESLAEGDNHVKFTLSDDTICQYLRAAATIILHSAMEFASGFSTYTSLPAWHA